MLTLQLAHSVTYPNSTHILWGLLGGRVFLGVFHPSMTPHPRRKHGWQMGYIIRYQVSAWKIYNVTKQWEADIKNSYLPSRLRGLLLNHSNFCFGFSSQRKADFPFNPFSFLIHAAQIRCFCTTKSVVCGSPGGCVSVCCDYRQRSQAQHDAVVKWRKSPTYGKGSKRSELGWKWLGQTFVCSWSTCKNLRRKLVSLQLRKLWGDFLVELKTCYRWLFSLVWILTLLTACTHANSDEWSEKGVTCHSKLGKFELLRCINRWNDKMQLFSTCIWMLTWELSHCSGQTIEATLKPYALKLCFIIN